AGVTLVHPPARWSLFDLALYLGRDAAGTLRLRLVYASDLWNGETAAAFLRQCHEDLLRAAGAGRAVPADAPPVCTSEPTGAEGPRRTYAGLVVAVLAHGRATPCRVALSGAWYRITYGELRRRVLQVSAEV